MTELFWVVFHWVFHVLVCFCMFLCPMLFMVFPFFFIRMFFPWRFAVASGLKYVDTSDLRNMFFLAVSTAALRKFVLVCQKASSGLSMTPSVWDDILFDRCIIHARESYEANIAAIALDSPWMTSNAHSRRPVVSI